MERTYLGGRQLGLNGLDRPTLVSLVILLLDRRRRELSRLREHSRDRLSRVLVRRHELELGPDGLEQIREHEVEIHRQGLSLGADVELRRVGRAPSMLARTWKKVRKLSSLRRDAPESRY